MKDVKKIYIISLLVYLIPLGIYLINYSSLPDMVPMHWDINGEVDIYGSKNYIFILFLIIFGLQLLMGLMFKFFGNLENQNKKIVYTSFFLMPVIITVIIIITIITTKGIYVNVGSILIFIIAFFYMIIGNYLPKVKHNYVIGIRVGPTLSDEEIWRKTHVFAGRIFFSFSVLAMIFAFINPIFSLVLILVAVVPCIIYPYVLDYKKNK